MKKMRLFHSLLTLILLFSLCAVPIRGQAAASSVEDNAGILSGAEIRAIDQKIQEVYEKTGVECYILTMRRGMDGDDLANYSERYIEAKTNHGALLIIDMVSRAYHLDGYHVDYMDFYMHRIEDAVESRLKAGDYAGGCMAFTDQIREIAEHGKPGLAEVAKARLPVFMGISLVIAGITILVLVKLMKPVAKAVGAKSYLVKDSFHLRGHREYFLYRNVTRTAKAKSSSGGGGGHSHGGGHF